MNVYNNFFVGVPIPENYIRNYEDLYTIVRKINPNLKLNITNNLHITILFIGKQNGKNIEKVAASVKRNIKILKDCYVHISGYGYFHNKNYDVLHLEIVENKKLLKFYKIIRTELYEIFVSEKKIFSPHLTLARVKNSVKGKELEKHLKYYENALKNVNWKFPIREINLYGRNGDNKNKQEIIETVKV